MLRIIHIAAFIIALGRVVAGDDRPMAHHYFSKVPHEHAAKWGYEGSIGPAHWGMLDRSYALAEKGERQSPIDIKSMKAIPAELPELRFAYRTEQIAAVNNGHTIQHAGEPGSFLLIGAKRFSLEQFHVHTPSEHTIDGKRFDLEIHFVHKSEDGQVVVVAVVASKDDKGTVEIPLYGNLPTVPGEKVTLQQSQNPTDYLPQGRDYFAYTGSFTTPPCTENIRWVLLKEPIAISPRVVDRFAAILKANNRPVQPANRRVVEKSR
ncbi:MAG: carbonic anhydrase [Planctomycetaceae bacterium]|jgi:carbonic anhydrase